VGIQDDSVGLRGPLRKAAGFGFIALLSAAFVCGCSGGPGVEGNGYNSTPTTAAKLCETEHDFACETAFACTPTAMQDAAFVAVWGTDIGSCMAAVPPSCAGLTCVGGYKSSFAASCLAQMEMATCDQVVKQTAPTPAPCLQACPQM
jgi:hypothetical protein